MTKPNRKLDRRVRRTRRQLQGALRQLIQEIPYNKISVTQIVDAADISRATYYLHYETKDELLLQCFATLADDVDDYVDTLEIDYVPLDDLTLLMFQQVSTNRALYMVLQDTTVLSSVMHQQVQDLIPLIHHTLRSTLVPSDALSLEFLAYQIAGALGTSASWWLDNKFDGTPEHVTAITLTHLRTAFPLVFRD